MQNGKTPGLAMPNPEAHEAVIREAYDTAGLQLSETAMVRGPRNRHKNRGILSRLVLLPNVLMRECILER
jgi:Polyketide synthase modules and related proteins